MTGGEAVPRFDWAASTGDHWLANADRLEAQLAPISELLFSRAGLAPGLSVLDVGCGRGSTTRAAAMLIGDGRAIGLDLSPAMIAGARDLDPMQQCTWIAADATDADLSRLATDVVISRFGLMFFAEPIRAMANVRRALRPGGRLVAVAFQQRHESPFQHLLFTAAADAAAQHGLSLPLGAPDGGAFAFGRPEVVDQILREAGWTEVRFERHLVPLHIAGPGATPNEASRLLLGTGPIADWLASVDRVVRDDIIGAMEQELTSHFDGVGMCLDAGVALITAETAG